VVVVVVVVPSMNSGVAALWANCCTARALLGDSVWN